MFDPITIGLIMQAFAAATVVAAVVYLSAKVVRDYIRERRTKQSVNAKAIVMVEKINNGDFSVVTGFLDGNTKITDSKVWRAKTLDEDLQKFPVGQPVMVES